MNILTKNGVISPVLSTDKRDKHSTSLVKCSNIVSFEDKHQERETLAEKRLLDNIRARADHLFNCID